MLVICRMKEFNGNWVSNVKFKHLLHMIPKYLLDNSINSYNSNESKCKTQAESYGFTINIAGKGRFQAQFNVSVLLKCQILMSCELTPL